MDVHIISGVPGYAWRHGCGPTAVGMVIGYYDTHGYPDLIPGDASTQTSEVNQAIASQGSGIRGSGVQRHYEDYSLPNDSGQANVIPDSSVTYPTGCHVDDCIADFMLTSWSRVGNFYGWSWSSDIRPSFTSYVNLRNSGYGPSCSSYYWGSSLTWSVLTNEVDNNRPMVFLVDTNADNYTDHFVTVVGYSSSPNQQYGCLDTWNPPTQIRWCQFRGISSSYTWGVWGGWSFSLVPAAMQVAPAGGLESTGPEGGPFNPSIGQYSLTNTGGQPLNWTAGKTQAWLTLSKSSGTLAAGASDTVTVSINSAANSLVAGGYSDTVTFTNTTNGNGSTTRTAALAVYATIRPDFDRDNDVDPDDLILFESCLSGAAVPLTAGCEGKDLDEDTDVDQSDFGLFQVCISGRNVPPDPNCASPCYGMTLIPAGEFLMGNSFDPGEGDSHELPRHAVYVDAFFMDRTEVTNQQYVDAMNWAKNQGNLITVTGGVVYKYNTGYPFCNTTLSSSTSRIAWNGSTFNVVSGKENHPMVLVSWYGSVAYANWRSAMQGKPLGYDLTTWNCNWNGGYRLPTEAEWEKAARGGVAGHRFSWSDTNTIQHARANYFSSSSYSYDTSPTRGFHPAFYTGEGIYTSPVGYFAANGYGLYDMAGNAWEWCNDWYSDSYYSSSPTNNPRGPASGTSRILRGGGWNPFTDGCRVARRFKYTPDICYFAYGFRLALDSE